MPHSALLSRQGLCFGPFLNMIPGTHNHQPVVGLLLAEGPVR